MTVGDDDLDGFEPYEDSAFFEAVRKADCWRDATKPPRSSKQKRGDLSRLAELLRLRLVDAPTGLLLTREESELFVDLLSRHDLKQKPGGRKVPAYKRSSWAELRLEIAAESVRYYQRRRLSFAAAVERVARENYVPEKALQSYLRGKLHSDR
jgi:hypothetical protein